MSDVPNIRPWMLEAARRIAEQESSGSFTSTQIESIAKIIAEEFDESLMH